MYANANNSIADNADEDFDDYDSEVWNAIAPNWFEYSSLFVFALLLITGLVGNFLVIFVVLKNEAMRTVTNYFLVNLAFADFMVLLFCLPFTVLWEITKTWWFGTALCKIIVYSQNLSVSVSVLTLTCISVERWYAICHPLSFRNTFKRTRISLVLIWISAACLSLPELVVLEATPYTFNRTDYSSLYFTRCTHTWDVSFQQAYQLAQTFVLYVIPVTMMAVMYGHIAYVLWVKSIPPSDCFTTLRVSTTASTSTHLIAAPTCGPNDQIATTDSNTRRHSSRVTFLTSNSEYTTVTAANCNADRLLKPPSPVPSSTTTGAGRMSIASTTSSFACKSVHSSKAPDQWKEREIMNRKKAAKMLIAVVVLFAICYLPTHVLNILIYFDVSPHWDLGLERSAFHLSIRLLCYFNSCINPIVYNFMSEKFQKEFSRVCSCLPSKYRRQGSSQIPTYESSALLAHGGRNGKPIDQAL